MNPLGEALERIVRAYRGSTLLANAQGVDYSRDVVSQGDGGHGKHGTTTTEPSFGDDPPLPVRIVGLVERVADVVERDLDVERRGPGARPAGHDRRSRAKRDEDQGVLSQRGDPTRVAYLFGRTTEGVRKLRKCHGLDPATGERVKRDTITAPARDQLRNHEREE